MLSLLYRVLKRPRPQEGPLKKFKSSSNLVEHTQMVRNPLGKSQSFHLSSGNSASQMEKVLWAEVVRYAKTIKKQILKEMTLTPLTSRKEMMAYSQMQFILTMISRLMMRLTLSKEWAAQVLQEVCQTQEERLQFSQALRTLQMMMPAPVWETACGRLVALDT
ncbi:accessory protein [Gierle apodemus virus]|uniref:Accessory protein n=1 Tax=Gierle apodemus virus TaxID=2940985 RepID=A0AAE9HV07_9MONO|nr:accessory protein [Gierle apodemus virus]